MRKSLLNSCIKDRNIIEKASLGKTLWLKGNLHQTTIYELIFMTLIKYLLKNGATKHPKWVVF